MNTVVHLHVYRAYVLTCASGRTFWKQLQSFEDFQVLARGDITGEERLLASQKAEDQGWRVNPSFSGIVSEKQCAVDVKCIPERSANVHVLTQQKRKEKKKKEAQATTHDSAGIDPQVWCARLGYKSASRGAAPQASYDRRRHRNYFLTRPAQAFPKK